MMMRDFDMNVVDEYLGEVRGENQLSQLRKMKKDFASGRAAGHINGYPAAETGPLTNEFIGICENEKMDNALNALNEWCGMHIDRHTQGKLRAAIIADRWEPKVMKQYDRILRTYLSALNLRLTFILVSDYGRVEVPFAI